MGGVGAVRSVPETDVLDWFCAKPARFSDSVTAVLMPEGHDADALPDAWSELTAGRVPAAATPWRCTGR